MTSFYKAFEDVYRGPREEIASRLRQYLPFLQPLKATTGQPKAVDLGCGRGEWLGLLDSLGFEYEGVDVDQDMLETCRAIGLNARKEDAHDYLRRQPDESLDLVTAFHLIEHMPFLQMNNLIGNAYRVLRPGGLLILETPNPENLLVATSSFYLDPTHVRPIPPLLLKFSVEYAGFARTTIVRLQENSDLHLAQSITLLDALGGVSPDYSVVALKASEATRSEALESAFSMKFGVQFFDLATRFESRLQQLDARTMESAQLLNKMSIDAERSSVLPERFEGRLQQLDARTMESAQLLNKMSIDAERSSVLAKRFEGGLQKFDARSTEYAQCLVQMSNDVERFKQSQTIEFDYFRHVISELSCRLGHAESSIEYVNRQKLIERLFFRSDGRPVKPLRRLLFHTSGAPRRFLRVLVLHKNGAPRSAFAHWMGSRGYLALRNAVKPPGHQVTERADHAMITELADPATTAQRDNQATSPRERYFLTRLLG